MEDNKFVESAPQAATGMRRTHIPGLKSAHASSDLNEQSTVNEKNTLSHNHGESIKNAKNVSNVESTALNLNESEASNTSALSRFFKRNHGETAVQTESLKNAPEALNLPNVKLRELSLDQQQAELNKQPVLELEQKDLKKQAQPQAIQAKQDLDGQPADFGARPLNIPNLRRVNLEETTNFAEPLIAAETSNQEHANAGNKLADSTIDSTPNNETAEANQANGFKKPVKLAAETPKPVTPDQAKSPAFASDNQEAFKLDTKAQQVAELSKIQLANSNKIDIKRPDLDLDSKAEQAKVLAEQTRDTNFKVGSAEAAAKALAKEREERFKLWEQQTSPKRQPGERLNNYRGTSNLETKAPANLTSAMPKSANEAMEVGLDFNAQVNPTQQQASASKSTKQVESSDFTNAQEGSLTNLQSLRDQEEQVDYTNPYQHLDKIHGDLDADTYFNNANYSLKDHEPMHQSTAPQPNLAYPTNAEFNYANEANNSNYAAFQAQKAPNFAAANVENSANLAQAQHLDGISAQNLGSETTMAQLDKQFTANQGAMNLPKEALQTKAARAESPNYYVDNQASGYYQTPQAFYGEQYNDSYADLGSAPAYQTANYDNYANNAYGDGQYANNYQAGYAYPEMQNDQAANYGAYNENMPYPADNYNEAANYGSLGANYGNGVNAANAYSEQANAYPNETSNNYANPGNFAATNNYAQPATNLQAPANLAMNEQAGSNYIEQEYGAALANDTGVSGALLTSVSDLVQVLQTLVLQPLTAACQKLSWQKSMAFVPAAIAYFICYLLYGSTKNASLSGGLLTTSIIKKTEVLSIGANLLITVLTGLLQIALILAVFYVANLVSARKRSFMQILNSATGLVIVQAISLVLLIIFNFIWSPFNQIILALTMAFSVLYTAKVVQLDCATKELTQSNRGDYLALLFATLVALIPVVIGILI